jgi:hypothetical protein
MFGASPSQILRTIPVLITACFFAFPAHAKYSGGSGEPNDPYQIATAADLITLGETPADYDKHFLLTADIDLDPKLPGRKVFEKAVIAPDTSDKEGWIQVTEFTGVFDGSAHTISHLTITGNGLLGLFGQTGHQADIRNLGVVGVNIAGSRWSVGGLVGSNEGTLTQCSSTGTISAVNGGAVGGLVGSNAGTLTQCFSTSAVTGDSGIGGLVGSNGGTLAQCYSTGAVSGGVRSPDKDSFPIGDAIGGLVGSNGGTLAQCYSTGAVSGTEAVGGLVGRSDGSVADCYSTGAASGTGQYSGVGGLIGANENSLVMGWNGTVTRCYSTGVVKSSSGNAGGLVGPLGYYHGDPQGVVLQCVWDLEASGMMASAGGVGLTTGQMMDPSELGLNGFGNDPNWVLDAGRDYPRLAWQGTPGHRIPQPEIDWLEGKGTGEDSYRVGTAEQLIRLGRTSFLWDKHVRLGANIDLDPRVAGGGVFGQAVIPVFAGVFDGEGHTISHLTVKGDIRVGLFGQVVGEVRDLGVVDANVTGSGYSVGVLVGNNEGTVTRCYSTGTVSGKDAVGGLVGSNQGNVTRCYSTVAVAAVALSADPSCLFIGGLVGDNGGGTVTQCYSTGMVRGYQHCYGVGGLVGDNWKGSVTTCYSTGAVRGGSSVGGLVGCNGSLNGDLGWDGYVIQCYSTGPVSGEWGIGGLVGWSFGSAYTGIDCFWDAETSGQAGSFIGTGKTTAEMQTGKTFLDAGWDFVGETVNGTEDIWWIDEGKDYPRLWWEPRN